jgi:L,D-transpeptidase catalytic domain
VGRSGGDGHEQGEKSRGRLGPALVVLVAAGVALAVFSVVFSDGTQRAAGSEHHATGLTAEPSLMDPKPAPRQSVGVQVAWSRISSLPVYRTPSGTPDQDLSNPNTLGAPLVMLVHSSRPGWVEVYLPERPNESLGWVPSSDVTLVSDDEHIVVSLSRRRVELFRGQKLVFESTAAVGGPSSPTPTGYFYVTEVLRLSEPGSAYGPFALGLSGFSGTYQTFEGGPGQIAIHGTDQPESIGEYASHGCVRLSNPEITALAAEVQAGTPVSVMA